jgi:large subunit ribosomal protein L21
MKYAIVESGGKQYRAVEGATIEVDRLAHETGTSFDFDRVLFMGDGDTALVGTPTVADIKVSATVMEHIKGPKVISFRYRPKKRIRVKSGHRQQYTLLMIDFIGKPGEERSVERAAPKKKRAAAAKQAEAPKEAEAVSPKKKPAAKKSTKKQAE